MKFGIIKKIMALENRTEISVALILTGTGTDSREKKLDNFFAVTRGFCFCISIFCSD